MPYAFSPLTLDLDQPFRIAHGTSTSRTNVLVRLDGGYGEGALPPYYPYLMEDVLAYLRNVDVDAILREAPWALEQQIDRLPPGPAPARAALDLALHDRWARYHGQPLYRLLGVDADNAPPSSVTLSIPEDLDAFREEIRRYDGWPVLKLKLGGRTTDEDEAIVRTAREETDAQLCVDANSAWSLDEATRLLPRLSDYDLLFVEQPLRQQQAEAWHELRRRLPADVPPIFADERIQTAQDVIDLLGAIDGINVKLTKAGGLRGTRQLISLARSLDLGVMLGCMIESAVAVTAAAHLAPLVDYADLDGPLHLAADPFQGLTLDCGRITVPNEPGLGVTPSEPKKLDALLQTTGVR